ncbi:MOSC domain-containing protein [soil metagenome]
MADPIDRPGLIKGVKVGAVAAVWRHPVKSLLGESVAEAEVGRTGLAGDRAFGVKEAATGAVLSAKHSEALFRATARTKDGQVVVRVDDGPWLPAGSPELDRALSALVGRTVAVTRPPAGRAARIATRTSHFLSPPGTFFDSAAVHLVTTACLGHFGALRPGDWRAERFRPNFVIETLSSLHGTVEEGWIGRTLTVGGAVLTITRPCGRCRMVTYAQGSLRADKGVLGTIARANDENLGVMAEVRRAGRAAVGDEVSLT